MAKKFMYRGKSAEELSALPLDEMVRLLPCTLRRTMKRASPKIRKFLERLRAAKKSGKVLKTHLREMPILAEMIGMHLKVHNGKEFADAVVAPEMVGKRLGEFAITTKLVKHSGPGIGATRGSKSVDLK